MVHIVPGAVWHPVDVGQRAARRKGRGLIGHVAVSGATNLVPSGSPATRGADWHFYLPKDPQPGGRFFQYIDLDLQSWSSMDANSDTASFESQGGLGTAEQVNAEPWTDNQIESAAIILAHLNETEGVPLQDMGNSLPGSRGFGVHRYGIDPWRAPGGQYWSRSRGKLCPGDAKIAQIPIIVARARELRGGSPTPPPNNPSAPPRLDYRACMVDKAGNPLPRNHYIGAIEGPAASHGGDSRYDSNPVRGLVQNVLQWFIYHGCVPGLPSSAWNSSPGWTNTGWNAKYTDPVARTWHARFYRATIPGGDVQIWADDYDRLARP